MANGADRDGAEQLAHDELPVGDDRPHPSPIGCPIAAVLEGRDRGLDVAVDERHPAVIERVRDLDRWLDPLQAVLVEAKLAEDRR